MDDFKKRKLILYTQLEAAEYYDAITAFEFASKYHVGTRKDGVTPELTHQIEIALFALLLPNLMHRHEVIATIALHDVREDFGIADSEVRELFRSPERRDLVSEAVQCMTKKFRGAHRNEDILFGEMSANPIASIAKGCDRQHNLLSMGGVFSKEKQLSYVEEVHRLFLPMLKLARKNFPSQTKAYEILRFNLKTQCNLITAGLNSL